MSYTLKDLKKIALSIQEKQADIDKQITAKEIEQAEAEKVLQTAIGKGDTTASFKANDSIKDIAEQIEILKRIKAALNTTPYTAEDVYESATKAMAAQSKKIKAAYELAEKKKSEFVNAYMECVILRNEAIAERNEFVNFHCGKSGIDPDCSPITGIYIEKINNYKRAIDDLYPEIGLISILGGVFNVTTQDLYSDSIAEYAEKHTF